MSGIFEDFRYSARTLRRKAAFSAIVVLTLGLAIGLNTALFSVVNVVLIRSLGYADPGRLVAIHESFPQSHIARSPFSPLDYEDLHKYRSAFGEVGAYRNLPVELSSDRQPHHIQGAKVSATLFRVLGVAPLLGRTFTDEEDRPGVNVAVLSWGLWQQYYAGDRGILGQTIQLDRQPYIVIGVMPSAFVFPQRGAHENNEPAEMWVPIAFASPDRLERGRGYLNSVVGRLKPGISVEKAQAELEILAGRIADSYPVAVRRAGFSPRLSAAPLREEISGRFRWPLIMLLAAGGFVLVMVCANIAILMLTRAIGRKREFAVRSAIGAGRGDLIRLLLCEALLLSIAGGIVGVTLAYWSVKAAPHVLTQTIPGVSDVPMDFRVLGYTALMCIASGIMFALVPLGTLVRQGVGSALQEETARTTVTRGRLRLQQSFVVSAVALAFVLLVGAGLLLRSFSALMAVDPGFRPQHVLTMQITLPRSAYPTPESVINFQRGLLGNLSSVPTVRNAAIASDFPLTALENRRFEPQGSKLQGRVTPMTKVTWVLGPYFETFGIKLVQGRFFTDFENTDDRRAVIVNEKLAELYWPGESPIGKRLKWGSPDSQYPWLTVIGVVSNVADGPIGSDPGVHAYEPMRQLPPVFVSRNIKVACRAEGDARALLSRFTEEVARLDSRLAIERTALMESQVNDAFAPRRFSTELVTAFAAGALVLEWIGLYGLLAYNVAERRREIAVRLAVGAAPRSVAKMIIAQGAQFVGIGLVVGFAASLGLTRFMSSVLYNTSGYDAITFIGASVVVALAALFGCSAPALRAANVEPATALRTE